MPLYHFNLSDHIRDPDLEGTELPDAEEARLQAIKFAGQFVSDNPARVDSDHDLQIEVTDHDGVFLFAVKVSVSD